MTVRPNSLHARDIASLVHPQTNLKNHLQTGPTIIEKARGIYVYDDEGKKYLEGAAGLWSASLGFGVERLAKVAYEQMRGLGYYQIYRSHSHGPAIELAERLLALAPVPMSKVLFQCSGSEANDTAIKLAWYYWNAVGKPEKRKIIARTQSYHGSTCATVSLTGKPDMHADFGLPFAPFLHTNFPHYYRFHENGESEERFSERMADALERMILAEGPDTVAAFWAEPVMGAGGAVVPPKGYFEKIQAILKKYDILFVADEVICGFGRTGNMWGSQTFNLKPDMISSAKALSASLAPISALLVNERIFQAMVAESGKLGSFAHGYTYAGHPVMAAVALETLKIYEEIDIVRHVQAVEPTFLEAIGGLTSHPLVGHFCGTGLIGGLEIVADKETRRAHDTALQVPGKIDAHARRNGLILRIIGNRVAFSPPLIITEDEIVEMRDKLLAALDATVAEIRQ
jgi:4-aminobutyrate--pyruvate transaminase